MSVINICGVLIHTVPGKTTAVVKRLENEPGVEVHNISDDGRLVVTVEKETQEETGNTLKKFQDIDHVISTSLVYQYFDDDVTEEELSP